jgi:glycosyltransferase involved in cell wall biosynthesis
MGLGVPVISHAVGAIPEVLEHGALGTLIRNQDPPTYVDAILRVRDAPDFVREQTTRATQHVIHRYSAERTVAEYLSIYEELGENIRA